MEPVLIEAYGQMFTAHPDACSVGRILEDPKLRNEFLGRAKLRRTRKPRRIIILETIYLYRYRAMWIVWPSWPPFN
jgi:hypothetical protein